MSQSRGQIWIILVQCNLYDFRRGVYTNLHIFSSICLWLRFSSQCWPRNRWSTNDSLLRCYDDGNIDKPREVNIQQVANNNIAFCIQRSSFNYLPSRRIHNIILCVVYYTVSESERKIVLYNNIRTRALVKTFWPERNAFLFFFDVVDIRTHMFFHTCVFIPLSLAIFSELNVKSRSIRNGKENGLPSIRRGTLMHSLISSVFQILQFYVIFLIDCKQQIQ